MLLSRNIDLLRKRGWSIRLTRHTLNPPLSGMNGWLDLLDKYIKKYLPAEKDDIEPPSKSDSKSNQISRKNDISPGLLIGANSTKTLESVAITISSDNRTFAFKMKFAWCVNLKQIFQV